MCVFFFEWYLSFYLVFYSGELCAQFKMCINLIATGRDVSCEFCCTRRLGTFIKHNGIVCLRRYKVNRVEPYKFINICSFSGSHQQEHEHRNLVVSVESSPRPEVNSDVNALVPFCVNLRDGVERAGICKTAAIGLQHQYSKSFFPRSSSVEIDAFVQCFYDTLLRLKIGRGEFFSMTSVHLAIEFAKDEIAKETSRVVLVC